MRPQMQGAVRRKYCEVTRPQMQGAVRRKYCEVTHPQIQGAVRRKHRQVMQSKESPGYERQREPEASADECADGICDAVRLVGARDKVRIFLYFVTGIFHGDADSGSV